MELEVVSMTLPTAKARRISQALVGEQYSLLVLSCDLVLTHSDKLLQPDCISVICAHVDGIVAVVSTLIRAS